MCLKTLFENYKTKVIFFSWFVDLIDLSKEVRYHDFIKEIDLLDGCVMNFIKKNNIKQISEYNNHFGTDEHKIIYNEYLKNFIFKHINI